MNTRAVVCPYSIKAFAFSAPIGGLAGLIGLGGGEFRLPVLVHGIGFSAKEAVPLNLTVSLFTLAFALATRSFSVPIAAVVPHLPEILGLATGGVATAIYGASLVRRLSDRRLLNLIGALLVGLGILMIAESFFRPEPVSLIPAGELLRAASGLGIGLGVGIASSVLGVAGGELLIPALVLLFGADVKVAGTSSVLISLVIVATGLWRYANAGALPLSGGAKRITIAMTVGSLLGTGLGALAVAVAPADFLRLFLGAILLVIGTKSLVRLPS